MRLNEIRRPEGARHRRKIVGRGVGSGHGKTSTKGHKGLLSRTGRGKLRVGFEGGQMSLIRRLPKRGFRSKFKIIYQILNIEQLNRFAESTKVTPELMYSERLIRKRGLPIKVLGTGEIKKAIQVEANAFSKSAVEKIEKAGGSIVRTNRSNQ